MQHCEKHCILSFGCQPLMRYPRKEKKLFIQNFFPRKTIEVSDVIVWCKNMVKKYKKKTSNAPLWWYQTIENKLFFFIFLFQSEYSFMKCLSQEVVRDVLTVVTFVKN